MEQKPGSRDYARQMSEELARCDDSEALVDIGYGADQELEEADSSSADKILADTAAAEPALFAVEAPDTEPSAAPTEQRLAKRPVRRAKPGKPASVRRLGSRARLFAEGRGSDPDLM